MKIPPLTEMEPLPPVPSCSRDLGLDEISAEESDFEDDEGEEGDEGQSTSSREPTKLDDGLLLDGEIHEEVKQFKTRTISHKRLFIQFMLVFQSVYFKDKTPVAEI